MSDLTILRPAPGHKSPPELPDVPRPPSEIAFRVPVRDPSPFFQSPPLFADHAHGDWFLERAWNKIPPRAGAERGQSFIRRDCDKFVVLHRYGEGVIFDAEGAINSPGFLNNMQTLPEGMVREGGHFAVDAAVLARAPRLEGSWLVFYNGNLQNYYHWLVEGLLPLHLLRMEQGVADQAVLPAHLPREGGFDHIGLLRLIGQEDLAIRQIAAPYVHLDKVVHLEQGDIDRFPAFVLRDFQDKVAKRFPTQVGHRIFIQRRALRSVENQAALDAVLTPLGFKSYRLEEMAAEAQIRLFAGASMVVSPHGAGLSNLVFAPPGCKVIELMPDCEMRPFFWLIGAKLRHVYGMLPCPSHDGRFNGRLSVDIQAFRSVLNMVMLQR
jgi:hypothetical protein